MPNKLSNRSKKRKHNQTDKRFIDDESQRVGGAVRNFLTNASFYGMEHLYDATVYAINGSILWETSVPSDFSTVMDSVLTSMTKYPTASSFSFKKVYSEQENSQVVALNSKDDILTADIHRTIPFDDYSHCVDFVQLMKKATKRWSK